MDLTNLRQINEQKTHDAVSQKRHNELLLDNARTQEVFAQSISQLAQFLDRKVTKTEVINQLREIGTPDVEKAVQAVESMHETLRTHENTDLSEVTELLKNVLDEARKIPKDKIEIPKVEQKDYAAQFKELTKTVLAVEKAVKAQELKVEAPVVNVPETQVNVEAPDLKPIEVSIEKSSKDVVKAVSSVKIPELDISPLEKLLKKTNKHLAELPELMPRGGGGSSGRATPYQDSNSIPAFVTLKSGGEVPVETKTGDTGTVTAVGDTITSTTLKAANATRTKLTVYNDSTATLYLKVGGGTASASSFTVKLFQDDSYETDFRGAVTGVWSADSGGNALVTEET